MPDPWAPPPADDGAPWHHETPWDEIDDDPEWDEDWAGPEYWLNKRKPEEDS
mgnify:CR=1 FL=1